MSATTLFAVPGATVRELDGDDVPALQHFFDRNPEYWLTINGRPPPPDLARLEFDERPPPHLPYERNWCCGVFDDQRQLIGACIVVAGFTSPRVWHLSLFIVATALRGTGVAQRAYEGLEGWIRSHGAAWLRLGVVQGNDAAERFWLRQGFVDLRQRAGIDTGGRINAVRVMLKPLAGAGIDEYLALAPRDRPDSTLP